MVEQSWSNKSTFKALTAGQGWSNENIFRGSTTGLRYLIVKT